MIVLEGGAAGTPRLKTQTRAMLLNPSDWALANGLEDEPRTLRDDARLRVTQWGPDDAGTGVTWIVVKNHGHSWPGGSEVLPESIIGPKSNAFDATSETQTCTWNLDADGRVVSITIEHASRQGDPTDFTFERIPAGPPTMKRR
jgi:poly(3-hydroxybutyrate) depolymerase